MIESMISAFAEITSGTHLLYLFGGVIIIFVLTVISIWFGARNAPTGETDLADENKPKPTNMKPQAYFAAFVVFLFAWGLDWQSCSDP